MNESLPLGKQDYLRLVIFQVNTLPFVLEVPAEKQERYGNWILESMDTGKTCVFNTQDSNGNPTILGGIRGSAIVGFKFEPIFARERESHPLYDDPEFVALSKRRLKLEVNNLENMNSGDEWKF